MTDFTNADFIDFGASHCGSMLFAKKLGGRKGIGIDLDEKKVKHATKKGYAVIHADVLKVNFVPKAVNFCILSHFLEHLESIGQVKKALEKAICASKHFVYFQGPFFDADQELNRFGLKFFWSDWHGHKMHVTSNMLARIFNSLKVSYTIAGFDKVYDSSSPLIHPESSMTDSFEYNPKKHLPKVKVEFNFPIYREIFGFVWINKKIHRSMMLEKKCKVYDILYDKE